MTDNLNPERPRSDLCVHEIDIYLRALGNTAKALLDLEPYDLRLLCKAYLAVVAFAESPIHAHLSEAEGNKECHEILLKLVREERGED